MAEENGQHGPRVFVAFDDENATLLRGDGGLRRLRADHASERAEAQRIIRRQTAASSA